MKRSFSVVAVLAMLPLSAFATASAQQGASPPPPKPAAAMSHHSSGWKELDAFHELLAATWHPVEKTGDFKPVREKAALMATAADTWAASKPPANCDAKLASAAANAVAPEARALANLITAKATDADVKAKLKLLHDRFEASESACKAPAHKDHH